jgi:hypothetical protein
MIFVCFLIETNCVLHMNICFLLQMLVMCTLQAIFSASSRQRFRFLFVIFELIMARRVWCVHRMVCKKHTNQVYTPLVHDCEFVHRVQSVLAPVMVVFAI